MIEQQTIFAYPDHYDRRANPATVRARRMTVTEAQRLRGGDEVLALTRKNTLARIKVTSVKTWKTRPAEVEVRAKFGLYEHLTYHATGDYVDGLFVAVD